MHKEWIKNIIFERIKLCTSITYIQTLLLTCHLVKTIVVTQLCDSVPITSARRSDYRAALHTWARSVSRYQFSDK